MTTNIPRASESGHWYSRAGLPCYEVKAKDGTMRAATLRDARLYGWYPGVTSIIKCAAAPNLVDWMIDQAILAALTLPRVDGETNDQLLTRIRTDSQEQAKKAREKGTDIHAAIQGHYEGVAPAVDMLAYVQGAREAIAANFGPQPWETEKACAHVLGFGTKADLSCAGVVLDFKGSEFDEAKMPTLKTWDEHAMQLAATREARQLPGARCAIAYVSRNVPGLCRIIEVDEADLQRGWDMFRGLLNYWKAQKRYYPELWKAKEAA